MLLAHGLFFLWPWFGGHPAGPVITNMVINDGSVINYRAVNIGIMHYRRIYINNRGIIAEMIALPTAAGKAYSKKSAAIVYAAVKANMRPPVTGVI